MGDPDIWWAGLPWGVGVGGGAYWKVDLGTKYLVPSTWYQVLGTKYLVPSPWYQVLGTKSLVPSPWYQVRVAPMAILG